MKHLLERDFFLCVGAAKAGTTTLASLMAEHVRGICVHREKEPGYFANLCSLSAFERGFIDGTDDYWLGDFSTAYTKLDEYPNVAERARREISGRVKIAYMIRNPLDQIISHYKHRVRQEGLRLALTDALKNDPRYWAYADYSRQIAAWSSAFSPDSIRLIDFSMLQTIEGQRRVVEVLANWLDCRFEPVNQLTHNNRAGGDAPGRSRFVLKLVSRNRATRSVKAYVPRAVRRILRPALYVRAADVNVSHAERSEVRSRVSALEAKYLKLRATALHFATYEELRTS